MVTLESFINQEFLEILRKMAEKKQTRKESEENNQTPEQKEEVRKTQLAILQSDSLRGFVVANAGRDISKYGEVGRSSTHGAYLSSLSNPDEYLGRILSNSFLGAEQKSGEMYGGAVTPIELLKTAEAFYFSGLNNIKVADILELTGADVSEKTISAKQRDMYMEDFKEEDENAYKVLTSVFVQYTQTTGVGEAIANSGKALAGNLEKILTQENSH